MPNGCRSPVQLVQLLSGDRRYQDLHDIVEGIAHKVLTDTRSGGLSVRAWSLGISTPSTSRRPGFAN